MMKKILFACFLLLGVTAAQAIPAKRGVRKTLMLKNGTQVEATLTGDEHVHFYQTDDGRAIQQVGEEWQFVNRDSLLRLHSQRLEGRNRVRVQRMNEAQRTAYTGKRRGLVILVEFSDMKFTYDKATFNDYFNKPGFDLDGMHGSVRDYFREQSYGQFDLEFDIVGPITLNTPTSYYAADDSRVATMVNNLCRQVDSQVDFSQYDWNEDGVVDQVYVIYAGYGAAQGAKNTIWPHEWTVAAGSGSPYKTGEGVTIGTYGISCELMGNGVNNTGHLDGIGTSCHEFSHCLGLPDFYDTSSSGTAFGMDVWSLMDYGCYNGENNGRCPAGYTAYERAFAGWLEPKELNSSCQIIDMPAIQDEPVAYIVYNDAHKDEYYLLANHQRKGFDEAAYGHGLLIVHVDYDVSVWYMNTVNATAARQRMTIIPADGSLSSKSISGDPFPGTSKNTGLTDTSRPAATLYNDNLSGQKFMGKPITEIDETNGRITFNFMGGIAVTAPVALEPSQVSAIGFTANWDVVDGATGYTVCLTKSVEPSIDDMIMLEEDFEGFRGLPTDVSTDLSAQLDEYTVVSGWTGQNLFAKNDNLQIGKLKAPGELISPMLSPKQGAITVLISMGNAAKVGTTDVEVRLIVPNLGQATATLSGLPVVSEEEAPVYMLALEEWPYGDFQIGVYPLSTGSGSYIYYLAALDGYYTWEELSAPAVRNLTGVANTARLTPQTVAWKFENMPDAVMRPRKAPVVTETLHTTSNNYFTFTDLEPALYSYRVRATTASGVSPWSEEMIVDLTDAIRPVQASPTLTGKTYLPDGRQVNGANLRPGLYIRDGKRFIVK